MLKLLSLGILLGKAEPRRKKRQVVIGMDEIGKVVRLERDVAVVEVPRSEACETCQACYLLRDGSHLMVAEARNVAGAKVGDRVKLELEAKSVLKAAFIAYIIPFFFFILGYAIGSWLASTISNNYQEITGFVVGFLMLGLAYFVVWSIDKKASLTKEYEPIVARIVSRAAKTKD